MIVHVRGTHGSGKSTLARKVMELYPYREPILREGRKQPIGYVCRDKKSPHRATRVLFVAGHYETPTGGCDTISKVDVVYDLVREYDALGYDVLFEGILAQHSVPRLLALKEDGFKIRVVVLSVPVDKAIRSVEKRRKERGDLRPLNPGNIKKEARSVMLSIARLRDMRFKVKSFSRRKAALKHVCDLLHIFPR